MKEYIMNLFKKPLVKKIWHEDGELYLHARCRSGLFYMPIKGGKQYSYWLACWVITCNAGLRNKGETIYRLMDIKDEPPHRPGEN